MSAIKSYILLIICIICSYGCVNNSEKALEYALVYAETNKVELQKVLDHYEKDTLKLAAARFLIEKMPYLNYYESDKYDQYKKSSRPIIAETGLLDQVAFESLKTRSRKLSEKSGICFIMTTMIFGKKIYMSYFIMMQTRHLSPLENRLGTGNKHFSLRMYQTMRSYGYEITQEGKKSGFLRMKMRSKFGGKRIYSQH